MHPYLPHLLSDISAAHRPPGLRGEVGPQTVDEHIEEVERWLAGEKEQSLSYYCGLKRDDFPPSGQLTDEDLHMVCAAYTEMLDSWNTGLDLPDEMPVGRKYDLMVSLLDEEFTPVDSGRSFFDFCSGYAPGCKLKEYCHCLEVWKEE